MKLFTPNESARQVVSRGHKTAIAFVESDIPCPPAMTASGPLSLATAAAIASLDCLEPVLAKMLLEPIVWLKRFSNCNMFAISGTALAFQASRGS